MKKILLLIPILVLLVSCKEKDMADVLIKDMSQIAKYMDDHYRWNIEQLYARLDKEICNFADSVTLREEVQHFADSLYDHLMFNIRIKHTLWDSEYNEDDFIDAMRQYRQSWKVADKILRIYDSPEVTTIAQYGTGEKAAEYLGLQPLDTRYFRFVSLWERCFSYKENYSIEDSIYWNKRLSKKRWSCVD